MIAWLLVLQRGSEKYVLLIKILKYEQRSSASMCHTSVKLITCCEAEGRRRHIALTITKQCAGCTMIPQMARGSKAQLTLHCHGATSDPSVVSVFINHECAVLVSQLASSSVRN